MAAAVFGRRALQLIEPSHARRASFGQRPFKTFKPTFFFQHKTNDTPSQGRKKTNFRHDLIATNSLNKRFATYIIDV
jgi:hypothetical protein